MKKITAYFCIFLIFPAMGFAQSTNSNTFQQDLQTIVKDARKGFPISKGSVKEDVGWYGTSYHSNMSIFGKNANAMLQYVKAKDNKY